MISQSNRFTVQTPTSILKESQVRNIKMAQPLIKQGSKYQVPPLTVPVSPLAVPLSLIPSLPDVHTHTIMTVDALLQKQCPQWGAQRPVNIDIVEKYKDEQRRLCDKFKNPIIIGDIIFCNLNGVEYLLDGQHRMEMIRSLRAEGMDFSNTTVSVQTFVANTKGDVDSLYLVANTRYTNNGNIDGLGNIYHTSTTAQQVIDRLKLQFNNFANQCKANARKAPHFDINDLSRELNKSGLLTRKSVDQIINLIIEQNTRKRDELKPVEINRCTDGFYLVYGEPKCRWVSEINNIAD